jgi:hypothetical protein
VSVFGRSSTASEELRRRLTVPLVILRIREIAREMQAGKVRRIGEIRGVGGDRKPRISWCPKVLSCEIWSSFDLAPWRWF